MFQILKSVNILVCAFFFKKEKFFQKLFKLVNEITGQHATAFRSYLNDYGDGDKDNQQVEKGHIIYRGYMCYGHCSSGAGFFLRSIYT